MMDLPRLPHLLCLKSVEMKSSKIEFNNLIEIFCICPHITKFKSSFFDTLYFDTFHKLSICIRLKIPQ